MRHTRFALLIGIAVLLPALVASAQHTLAAKFDLAKPLTLKGTLTKWEMINPHSWFHIEVKQPDGQVVEWMVEGGSPNSLIRVGVTKYSLQAGMELTIEAYQAKDATNKAVGRNFVLPNGKRLFVGSNSGPDAPPATPDAVQK